jgi:hypothetical protein
LKPGGFKRAWFNWIHNLYSPPPFLTPGSFFSAGRASYSACIMRVPLKPML